MSRVAPLIASRPRRPVTAEIDITVSSNFLSCRLLWRSLQDHAVTTVFQSIDWLESWHSHMGVNAGVRPIIVIGRRPDGSAAFILPFGLARKRGSQVLSWLSAPHGNYGFAVFDTRFLEQEADKFPEIWQRIVAMLPKHDAIVLNDQPVQLQGFQNPFEHLRTCASADCSYILELNQTFDTLLRAKFSSRTRRRLTQNQRKLQKVEDWRMTEACSDADILRVTGAMFTQKRRQLAKRGISDPFGQDFEAFFRRFALCGSAGRRALRCYYIECEGEIVATNFGAVHDGTYYGLVTTMDEGRFDQLSPGGIAMNHAIEMSCRDGLAAFDFAAGDAEYKTRWSDRSVDLFETHVAQTAKGHVYCLSERARVWLKRRIKHSPKLWRCVRAVRALRAWRLRGAAVL